jgi:hypothetical protein
MNEANSNSMEARHNKMVKLKYSASFAINKLIKKIIKLIKGDAIHVIRHTKK